MLIPLILSGGSGTRLWPLSRELYPKQLLPLLGERTMLQETVTRVIGLPELAAPIVVCNESHRFMVAEQLREHGMPPQAIILEPVGRNTAPAVAVAALVAIDRARKSKGGKDSDPILLVLPADHVIRDNQAFQAAVAAGWTWVGSGRSSFARQASVRSAGCGLRTARRKVGRASPQQITRVSSATSKAHRRRRRS
jgi:mannose-1-phosphate guanylyltransferase/mannose-6-phosphate isomerase